MAAYRYPIIAKESWYLLGVVTVCAVTATYTEHTSVSIPLWLVLVVLLYLFRDPSRQIPSSPLAIVSPVDGDVIDIVEDYDDYLNRKAIKIEMKMNVFGIYSVRSPIEGKVIQHWVNDAGQSSTSKQIIQWIQSDEGDDVLLCLHRDLVTRRPGCSVHSGDRVGQGERCGFIHFGIGKVKLIIPVNSRIEVKKNDKLLAGSDIVAMLVHN